MRCPPVPPPASRTFIAKENAECGMRNAEYKGRVESRNETRAAIPHSAFRTPHWVHSAFRTPHSALFSCVPRPPPPSNPDAHPGRTEAHEQPGGPVRAEGQRERGGRGEREPQPSGRP